MRIRTRIFAILALSAAALAIAAPATATAAPATAAPAPAPAGTTAETGAEAPAVSVIPTKASGTSDFTFDSFDAKYTLSRDDENRSTLHVVETLVARFPAYQNRGILRDLPTSYRGHTTQLHIVSVTDENGRDRDYETSFVSDGNGSFRELKIGVPEGYYAPAGANTYVIEYTQKDVTLDPDDSTADEFFWDVNGTGWQQPFGSVSASLILADGLADELNGDATCYYGPAGSTQTCDIVTSPDGVITASTPQLGPYNNMSIAIGFEPDTFAPARFELFAYVPLIAFLGAGVTLLAFIVALIARFTALRDAPGRGIVVAQYEPQPDIGLFLAANLTKTAKRGMGSAIVDLAVRRNIRILERPAGHFSSAATFGVESVTMANMGPSEKQVMEALFLYPVGSITDADPAAAPAATGETVVKWLTKDDVALGRRVIALTKGAAAEAVKRGLRRKPPAGPILGVGAVAIVGFLLLLGAGISSESESGLAVGIFGSILSAFLGVATLGLLAGRRPLTQAGAEALEHLEGVREYIRLAEADRLQMLQSVTGAERTGGVTGETVIKVYERLLPYAILFGLEKEWANELAKYYDATPPDWYNGGSFTAFQVGAFAASMGSFSSTVSTSYSGSSSSSSSGGSSGGGSSGGGGGGGGGGGF